MPTAPTTLWPWPALAAARRHDPARRLPLWLDTAHGAVAVGSVGREHLGLLARWPQHLRLTPQAVWFIAPASQRDAAFEQVNAALREAGAVIGWRDESIALPDPAHGTPLARIERASARFWGTLTLGAHANGYLADARGRPTHLWLARRSADKATDPGLLDNLIGGGVPHGQTPAQTLCREGWEEAGLDAACLATATPGRVLHLLRDLPEGLQHERLFTYDLCLPTTRQPCNQDGEVAEWRLLPVDEALAWAAGPAMTVDASLVTLDFALRHRVIDDAALAARLEDALAVLTRPAPFASLAEGGHPAAAIR